MKHPTALQLTHAIAFAVRYAELAASCHAEAAWCMATGMETPALRLQSDAAYFAGEAMKYRLIVVSAGPVAIAPAIAAQLSKVA
jgi:hypothetical protein